MPLRIHDSFVYSYFSMAVRPSNDSTGYETLAYADMSATQGKQATHFNIASDDEIPGQHSAADNFFRLTAKHHRPMRDRMERAAGP